MIRAFIFDENTAAGIAEGRIPAESNDQYIAAWQHLVDTNALPRMEPWFWRSARELIAAGLITQGRPE